MKTKIATIKNVVDYELIQSLALLSNYKYGTAIFSRDAVEIIDSNKTFAEAWVGGLKGPVIEGGGSRRRVTFIIQKNIFTWHCTGNPKKHQIFCKHCVALALALLK